MNQMLDCIRSPTASDARMLQKPYCFRRPTTSEDRLLQTTDCFRRPTASDDRLLQTTDCFRRPTASDDRLLQTHECFIRTNASDAGLLWQRRNQTSCRAATLARPTTAAGTCRWTRPPPPPCGKTGAPGCTRGGSRGDSNS
jgi:hypothetical protein